MDLQTPTGNVIDIIGGSPIFRGALSAGVVLLVILLTLAITAGITLFLKRFFKRTPWITRAHRTTIYLLTMAGVLALVLGGVLGFFLPIIPGFLLLFFAFILLKRYYRYPWVDRNIRWLRFKLRLQQGVRKIKKRLHESGKHLRGEHKPRR